MVTVSQFSSRSQTDCTVHFLLYLFIFFVGNQQFTKVEVWENNYFVKGNQGLYLEAYAEDQCLFGLNLGL